MNRHVAKYLFAVLCGVMPLLACSTLQVEPAPPALPNPWNGRALFNTPWALVYAGDETAASDADALMRSVAERHDYFQSPEFDAQQDKGVIIVVDAEEQPLVADDDVAFGIFVRGFAALSGFPPPSSQQLTATRKRLTKFGEPANGLMTDMLATLPWAVTPKDANDAVGLPASVTDKAAWIARLPTTAHVTASAKAIVPKLLDHAERTGDLSDTGRLMIGPFTGLIRSKLASELLRQRDESFEQIARQRDPAWIAVRDARRDSMKDWRVLASAHAKRNQVTDVLDRAEAALTLAPNDLQVMRVRAAAQYRAGEYQAALESYDAIEAALADQRKQARANGLGDLAQSLMPNIGGTLQRNIENATRLQPVDLAFRAMAFAQLKQHEAAAKSIDALNQQLKSAGSQPMGASAIYAEARRMVKMLKTKAGD